MTVNPIPQANLDVLLFSKHPSVRILGRFFSSDIHESLATFIDSELRPGDMESTLDVVHFLLHYTAAQIAALCPPPPNDKVIDLAVTAFGAFFTHALTRELQEVRKIANESRP